MSELYGDHLRKLEGPVLPYQSRPFGPPMASSGDIIEFGLSIGNNRGLYGSYAKNIIASGGYSTDDVICLTPDFMEPVATPGGNIQIRVNPSKITARILQNIYNTNRTSGARFDLDGSVNFSLMFRGLFAAGPGPYGNNLTGKAPNGPMVAGETAEFSLSGNFAEIGCPSDIDPFMWTLFGRCLVADGGCAIGDIMAFGSAKGFGTIRGWTTSYSPDNKKFTLSDYANPPSLVGKASNAFTITLANWSFFFRFVGFQAAGPYGRVNRFKRRTDGEPLSMWMTPHIPFNSGLVPVTLDCGNGFSPSLAFPMYCCKIDEFGFSVGDWVMAQEGNHNSQNGGFSAVFDGNNMTLTPYQNTSTQFLHRLDTGAQAVMTPANWSWFYLFVG